MLDNGNRGEVHPECVGCWYVYVLWLVGGGVEKEGTRVNSNDSGLGERGISKTVKKRGVQFPCIFLSLNQCCLLAIFGEQLHACRNVLDAGDGTGPHTLDEQTKPNPCWTRSHPCRRQGMGIRDLLHDGLLAGWGVTMLRRATSGVCWFGSVLYRPANNKLSKVNGETRWSSESWACS